MNFKGGWALLLGTPASLHRVPELKIWLLS